MHATGKRMWKRSGSLVLLVMDDLVRSAFPPRTPAFQLNGCICGSARICAGCIGGSARICTGVSLEQA
eukprot:13966-Chlamydomonas_euryale.AAC.7